MSATQPQAAAAPQSDAPCAQAGTVTHDNFHVCECYGHDMSLPDYKRDVSIPRTLQGFYAKKGGCPCGAFGKCAHTSGTYCPANPATVDSTMPRETYRANPGPHTVYPKEGADEGRDPATGLRTTFPNARNYGGTVAQRGPTTLASTQFPRSSKKAERDAKAEAKRQDRKNFLQAVLRDEMLARMDAEAEREALEGTLGLFGANHAVEYEDMHGAGTLSGKSKRRADGINARCINDVPSVGEQYEEIMDELRYVVQRPVGSKFNVVRLHYLIEEEDRVNGLRRDEKMQRLSEAYARSAELNARTKL